MSRIKEKRLDLLERKVAILNHRASMIDGTQVNLFKHSNVDSVWSDDSVRDQKISLLKSMINLVHLAQVNISDTITGLKTTMSTLLDDISINANAIKGIIFDISELRLHVDANAYAINTTTDLVQAQLDRRMLDESLEYGVGVGAFAGLGAEWFAVMEALQAVGSFVIGTNSSEQQMIHVPRVVNWTAAMQSQMANILQSIDSINSSVTGGDYEFMNENVRHMYFSSFMTMDDIYDSLFSNRNKIYQMRVPHYTVCSSFVKIPKLFTSPDVITEIDVHFTFPVSYTHTALDTKTYSVGLYVELQVVSESIIMNVTSIPTISTVSDGSVSGSRLATSVVVDDVKLQGTACSRRVESGIAYTSLVVMEKFLSLIKNIVNGSKVSPVRVMNILLNFGASVAPSSEYRTLTGWTSTDTVKLLHSYTVKKNYKFPDGNTYTMTGTSLIQRDLRTVDSDADPYTFALDNVDPQIGMLIPVDNHVDLQHTISDGSDFIPYDSFDRFAQS